MNILFPLLRILRKDEFKIDDLIAIEKEKIFCCSHLKEDKEYLKGLIKLLL